MQLFQQRLAVQWRRYLKLSRYVFNDHAVIAFVILLGAAMLAYRNLWMNAPITWWAQALLIGLTLLTLGVFNKPASFLQPADPVFLLGDEAALRELVQKGTRYSMVVNGLIEGGLAFILWPMYLREFKVSIIGLIVISGALMLIKMTLTQKIAAHAAKWTDRAAGNLLNWRQLEQKEAERRGRVDGFFNLFIDIPGQQQQVRQHKWFETWLRQLQVLQAGDLLTIAFLRTPAFFDAWLRLTIFGFGLGVFTSGWLRVALLVLFLYMLILQLLPLAHKHEQIVFDHLLPITDRERRVRFTRTVRPWFGLTTLIYMASGLVNVASWQELAILLVTLAVAGHSLLFFYSDFILKNNQKKR